MGRNDPRAKRPTGETTHIIRANRPTPKTRAKRPRANRPGETTHRRNDPDSALTDGRVESLDTRSRIVDNSDTGEKDGTA